MKPGERYPGEFDEFGQRRSIQNVAVGSIGGEDGDEEVSLDITFEDRETIQARVSPGVARIVAGGIAGAVDSIDSGQTKSLRQSAPDPGGS